MPVMLNAMRSPRFQIGSLILLAAAVYAACGLLAHWHFRSNYDLAIFDQAIWHMSRFEAPASSVRGLSNIMGDHFSPILVLLAPLYWLAPAAETLIVAQACLFAASILPVSTFLRRRLPDGPALALCAAYASFWGLQRAAVRDFHEVAFAPLLIATLILAMDGRRWRVFWVAAAGLALVKEDFLPLLTLMGVYLAARGERRRGVLLASLSLGLFFVITGVVIPWFNDTGAYAYTGTYRDVLARPWRIPVALVTPGIKVATVFLWLAPFAFLPLRSPITWLLVPFALARFLSSAPAHWGTSFHYSAPLAPILAMAAGDGLARITLRLKAGPMRTRWTGGLVAACVVFSLLLPGRQPLWRLFRADEYRQSPFLRSGRQALNTIPAGASVVAQTAVAPHLSHRESLHRLDADAPDADFIIAASNLSPWPIPTQTELGNVVRARLGRGYRVIFEENGWIVLARRDVSDPTSPAPRSRSDLRRGSPPAA